MSQQCQGPGTLRLRFPSQSLSLSKVVGSLFLSCFPPTPVSRALGHCAPDNTWKALSTQECPPTQAPARLHADSWQPAQADKLIRPNLSMARPGCVLPQISLSCLSALMVPKKHRASLAPGRAQPQLHLWGPLGWHLPRTNSVSPRKSQVSRPQFLRQGPALPRKSCSNCQGSRSLWT